MLDGGGGRPGIPLSEERRRELGELNRRLNTGKHASDETKAKMSAARKGKQRATGIIDKAVQRRSENMLEGKKYDTMKLSVEDVVEIKNKLMNGENRKAIADAYHISASNINAIRSNRSWKFVIVEGWDDYCAQTRQSRSATTRSND